MRIVIFRGINFQWYFRVVARNGRTVAQSEGYKRKSSAIKTAEAIRDNLFFKPIEVRK